MGGGGPRSIQNVRARLNPQDHVLESSASPLQKQGLRSARRGRSVHGLTSPSPRIDLPLQKRGSRSAGWGGVPRSRGRSVHGLTSPSPRIDLPLQKQGLRSAVGQVCAWVDLALSAHRPAPTKTGIAVGAQGQVCSWVDLSLSAHRPAPTKTGDRGRHLQ